MSSSVLTERNVSHKSRSVMGGTTVRMDLTKKTVQYQVKTAIAVTTPAVYRRPSCVMEKKTVLMDQMKETVVGELQQL